MASCLLQQQEQNPGSLDRVWRSPRMGRCARNLPGLERTVRLRSQLSKIPNTAMAASNHTPILTAVLACLVQMDTSGHPHICMNVLPHTHPNCCAGMSCADGQQRPSAHLHQCPRSRPKRAQVTRRHCLATVRACGTLPCACAAHITCAWVARSTFQRAWAALGTVQCTWAAHNIFHSPWAPLRTLHYTWAAHSIFPRPWAPHNTLLCTWAAHVRPSREF